MTAMPQACQPVCHAYGLGCACRPGIADLLAKRPDGRPASSPYTGVTDAAILRSAPRERRREGILTTLIRRPARTAQLERLLDRYRWTNAGLRERLAALDDTLARIDGHVDEQARILGHAHPAIVLIRDEIAQARR